MKHITLGIALACAVAPAAFACGPKDVLVFSCNTTRAKVIEVCQTPTEVSYAYGKPVQKPELSLRVPTGQLDWTSSGGSSMNFDTITFHNGKTTYALNIESVFGTDDGDGQGAKPSTSATLDVRSGASQLATLECKPQGMQTQLQNLKATPRSE